MAEPDLVAAPIGLVGKLQPVTIAFLNRIGKTKYWKRARHQKLLAWNPREVHEFFRRMLGQKEE